MEPFTEYFVLLAFSRRADGDFSYLWYDSHFTETIRWVGARRVYTSMNAKDYHRHSTERDTANVH